MYTIIHSFLCNAAWSLSVTVSFSDTRFFYKKHVYKKLEAEIAEFGLLLPLDVLHFKAGFDEVLRNIQAEAR